MFYSSKDASRGLFRFDGFVFPVPSFSARVWLEQDPFGSDAAFAATAAAASAAAAAASFSTSPLT